MVCWKTNKKEIVSLQRAGSMPAASAAPEEISMSDERTYPMTEEGLQNLREELDHLVKVKKPEIAERLRLAIAQGDLSENADYADAKEQQAFLEGRILYVEEMIRGAVIIQDGSSDGTVALGNQATVVDDEGDEQTYTLVGAAEANPREGRISNESPLGKALLGGKAGDEVRVAAPGGDIIYKILAVE
jgi:transcription elongation factor GreA